MKTVFKKEQKKGVNPVVAMAAGLAVGVGAAVATSNALRNKKNKQKVNKIVSDAREKATVFIDKKRAEFKSRSKSKPVVKKSVKIVKKVNKTKKVK